VTLPIPTSRLRRTPLSRRIDGAIALLVFLMTAAWVFAYWKHVTAHGQPFFYQLYFEPSVMVACGKGFVVARPQVPEMVSFLRLQQDRFPCEAIPANAALTTDDMPQQGPWRYLMLTVGWTWRIFGVAWSALGPLFAMLFAGTVTAGYLIFRLGVGRPLALLGTIGLATSRMHLKFLLELRDYAKSPWMLVLVLLLGLLVLGRVSWKRTITIAVLYGVVLGIGYGFRSDFLAYIPPFFVALLFLPGGIVRNLAIKAAAGVVCVGTFLVVAWPALSTLEASKPGCTWHIVLLGFARQYDRPLGVTPAPYEAAREYLDEWEYTTTTSYAARLHPGIGHIEYCEPPYGTATREYLIDVIRHFPADIIVRTYASVLRVVELPFLPIEGRDDDDGRVLNWDRSHHVGLVLVTAATLAIATVDLRLGLFVLFLVLYFAGLPAIQFSERHYFHFEFLTWFAALFLVQLAFVEGREALSRIGHRQLTTAAVRAAVVIAGCVAVLVAILYGVRAYQEPRVRTMLVALASAPRDRVEVLGAEVPGPELRTAPHTDPETADFVVVELNTAACSANTTVAFTYAAPRRAYGRIFTVDPAAKDTGDVTRILSPVYDGFERLAFDHAPRGCISGVYRMRKPERFALLPEVILSPDWRVRPLYQRLSD